MWLTHYDAEIIGSNSPIVIDEKELDRRIAEPRISRDLKKVMMGDAADFLSYFVMGDEGMKAFGSGGIVNTDDNLYLEFSAPFSIGRASTMEANVKAIIRHRESILPYLAAPADPKEWKQQQKRWANQIEAVNETGQALAAFLGGKFKSGEFKRAMEDLGQRYPEFAPARFLKSEYMAALDREPRLIWKVPFILTNEKGERMLVEISAVFLPISEERASVAFVDNQARVIYGELFVSGLNKGQVANQSADEIMTGLQWIYHQEVMNAQRRGLSAPMAGPFLQKVKEMVVARTSKNNPS